MRRLPTGGTSPSSRWISPARPAARRKSRWRARSKATRECSGAPSRAAAMAGDQELRERRAAVIGVQRSPGIDGAGHDHRVRRVARDRVRRVDAGGGQRLERGAARGAAPSRCRRAARRDRRARTARSSRRRCPSCRAPPRTAWRTRRWRRRGRCRRPSARRGPRRWTRGARSRPCRAARGPASDPAARSPSSARAPRRPWSRARDRAPSNASSRSVGHRVRVAVEALVARESGACAAPSRRSPPR